MKDGGSDDWWPLRREDSDLDMVGQWRGITLKHGYFRMPLGSAGAWAEDQDNIPRNCNI